MRGSMTRVTFPLARVCALLFFSGLCALTYQVAWFRELRLIFGASTAASAAVLAVFMGGLGVGGFVLGKRADRAKNALELYGNLEIAVAITAAATPIIVRIAERGYLALGGSLALGSTGAAIVRLLLSALVLGPSTILMGGTLPAAARAVERESDVGRQRVAALYGVNTFGAVAGSFAANFLLLEVFGTQLTQWIAALVNLLVGVLARVLSRQIGARRDAADASAVEDSAEPVGPRSEVAWFPPLAAGLAGATFMLMELVWYRMLAPILGGSSYTFGLILGVALIGIAVGGLVYARSRVTPTFRLFAITCAVEALFIAVPYALGDRLATLSLLLRPFAHVGFAATVGVWAVVASIVILPAAIVSGVQFAVIIGLYGHGANGVGRDVGKAYFANTVGSIAGSILGGFGLLPLLTGPGCWRLVVIVLAATAALAIGVDVRARGREAFSGLGRIVAPVAGALALACLLATGPTAVWRHAGIGAGRADRIIPKVDAKTIEAFQRESRDSVLWQEDGRESTVALADNVGFAFIVNGKSDGNATQDSGTQIMGGLLGALLHDDAKRAMVIGLGTGSTAGWLAKVDTMEKVDVVELEPAILRVARDCAPVNGDVLANPKISVSIADAREALLTSRESYDIIFSEPSNPYRAGISSLYTAEFYRAAATRVRDRGLFIQWVQAYEIDEWALATVATTLREVFGVVSLWQTMSGDLVFVAQNHPLTVDVARVRARFAKEPFRSAGRAAWRSSSVEGLLAHVVGAPALVEFLREKNVGVVNRDDQNFLEFAFARSVGMTTKVETDIIELSRRLGTDAVPVTEPLDPNQLLIERWMFQAYEKLPLHPPPKSNAALAPFGAALEQFRAGRNAAGYESWKKLGRTAPTYYEGLLAAYGAARANDPDFSQLVTRVDSEAERELLRALFLANGGRDTMTETLNALERGFLALRRDPWIREHVLTEALRLAVDIGVHDMNAARRMFDATSQPFAVDLQRRERVRSHVALGSAINPAQCVKALDTAYRVPPWSRSILLTRATCLAAVGDPRAASAQDDLSRFLEGETSVVDLVPAKKAPNTRPDPKADTRPDGGPDDGLRSDAGAHEDEAPGAPLLPEPATNAAGAR